MSSDESSNAAAPRERRDAVREKAQQVQARQTRFRRIRVASVVTSIVAVVAIAGVVVTWAVSSAASKPSLSPVNVTDDGFTVTTVPDAAPDAGAPLEATPTPTETPAPAPTPTSTARPAVDIRVYVDYLSAGSRDFQVANAKQLSTWVGQDAATLSYFPVAMLTAKSNGTKYSLRAASAAACVAANSPDAFFAFNNALLARQPEVESDGYTNAELADLAIASGASSPKVVRACIEDESYSTWAKGATERALKGLSGTEDVALTSAPMVLVNGQPYVGALGDPKEFAQFVLTIASDAYYEASPSPTPTATP